MIPPPVDTDVLHPRRRTRTRATTSSSRPSLPTSASSWRSTPTAARAAPLRIVGTGPEEARLRQLAPREVDVPRPRRRRGAARAVPRLPRRAHARDRGLRHRAARGDGLRPAGGRLRRGRRRRDGRARQDRPRVPRADRRRAARGRRFLSKRPRFDRLALRARAEAHRREVFETRMRAFVDGALASEPPEMLKFQTRVVVATYVLADVLATAVAWVLAYLLRFHAASWPLSCPSPRASRLSPTTCCCCRSWPSCGRRSCTSTASTSCAAAAAASTSSSRSSSAC